MGFRLPGIVHAKKILQKYPFNGPQSAKMTPEGYVADYVGENEMKRFMISVSYQAEKEFGFDDHPAGGLLRIPCGEDVFTELISRLNKQ
ncbi:saur-like auxin-responsive protein family [Citrus sinensis]|uniref:Uncharacterized protein n=1 Tax=Citrus clementina TaxID=85681 RepID=V4SD97_CITCL|nr:hypothetical protein CICLE_v10030353mg [Citrus x clementina]KAH9657234.1 saur-like auxin-responsive protein family [Citrus sinensis]